MFDGLLMTQIQKVNATSDNHNLFHILRLCVAQAAKKRAIDEHITEAIVSRLPQIGPGGNILDYEEHNYATPVQAATESGTDVYDNYKFGYTEPAPSVAPTPAATYSYQTPGGADAYQYQNYNYSYQQPTNGDAYSYAYNYSYAQPTDANAASYDYNAAYAAGYAYPYGTQYGSQYGTQWSSAAYATPADQNPSTESTTDPAPTTSDEAKNDSSAPTSETPTKQSEGLSLLAAGYESEEDSDKEENGGDEGEGKEDTGDAEKKGNAPK